MKLLCALVALGFATLAAAAPATRRYEVEYGVRFEPSAGVAHASIAIARDTGWVSRLVMEMPESRYRNLDAGTSTVSREGDRVTWTVPREGGTLRYDVVVDHRRANGAYDARLTPSWTIVRGDALFPPAKVRATKNSESSARLKIDLPTGWSDRESGYRLAGDGRFIVVTPGHRFDRPVGWIAAGNLTTTKETIAGTDFRVTAPKGEGFDRLQVLSMLRLAAPHAKRAFGRMPEKLLILGAGDPMWRGGLTGPRSIWLHSDRKPQSENGTSPLLHELAHAITGLHAAKGDDWIVEGIAEYYSIELGRRAGLLSDALAERAIRIERKRGAKIETLQAPSSSGRRTARAVAVFADLDAEIRKETDNAHSLDDVVQALMRADRVSATSLAKASEKVLGRAARSLPAA